MNTQTKHAIKEKLSIYVDRFDSQNKAANSLTGVSSATLSQIQNNKWDLIKDEMWRNIASQIGYEENQWNIVETRDFRMLSAIMKDAQEHSNVFAVVGSAGSGKTLAQRSFSETNKKVYLVQCAEYWNRKFFLAELLTKMGRDYSGLTVAEMMHEAVRVLKMQDKPLLILDEADKLSDQVLYFFITLYNQLEDNCGILICATDHLAKRINRGRKLNKKGYNEIYSRIGRKFIELKGVGSTDVEQICRANGVNDKNLIKEIFEDSEYDLRRVKRKIHAIKMLTTN
ncbi:MAG: ATP-binding protein [Flavobacteriia bacterium]|nr:ATP-binding protein [Flavobacteriia bacterium]